MTNPPLKRRRTELTLADKIKLIKEAETSNLTGQMLGDKYGVGKTTRGVPCGGVWGRYDNPHILVNWSVKR